MLAHFSSFVALHQWQDLEAGGRVPYTIFLPDPKVSVGFTTIGRLLKPAVTKQDRPKPKACSGKDCQRCDKLSSDAPFLRANTTSDIFHSEGCWPISKQKRPEMLQQAAEHQRKKLHLQCSSSGFTEGAQRCTPRTVSCSRRSFCEAVSPFSGHSLKRGAS